MYNAVLCAGAHTVHSAYVGAHERMFCELHTCPYLPITIDIDIGIFSSNVKANQNMVHSDKGLQNQMTISIYIGP